ncbi:addiction module antidote protein, HigA family [Salegentibacter echinorum]|uniref:Addiction module antidote protein, HigA family n=1 Tax=Salegentibacter echinorum TaxID=1073325 RepID=A0A1M5BVF1_SALEC|nr:HigA family addiction module antitoxin [Salegentibacter echinorum]SHF46543.1 addiction module antidote protein, HigA family [Salegentibacter echinorum]
MIPEISKIKGIHPGAVLKREIKQRGIKSKDLALWIGEHAQTISAIINERRNINPGLSIKLGKILGVEKDYFMHLQASFDVKKLQSKNFDQKMPNLTKIRRVLFWDTDFTKIDWIKDRKAIIKRVFERGNPLEIKEIINFYGKDTIQKELTGIKNNFLPSFRHNLVKYLEEETN